MKFSNNEYRPVMVIAPGILAGAEKVVLSGADALYRAGLNPLVVIIKEKRVPDFAIKFKSNLPEYIENKTIESIRAIDVTLLIKLNKIMKAEKIKPIIHTHGFKALIACLFSSRRHILIHTHHGNTSHTLKVRFYEKLAFLSMKKCNYVIAVSKKMNEELKNKLTPFKNILMIENLLPTKSVDEIRISRNNTQRNKNIINLIFIGRLSPEKGILQFLDYFSTYSFKDSFHLTILGDGIQGKLINSIILKNKLQKHVTIQGFVLNIAPYLIRADVLIMPSLTEGLPLTLIEALSVGIPVIANRVGGIPDLIDSGFNGLLTKDNTEESWNEVLDQTILNYNRWSKNAEAEARIIENRFSSTMWASNTKKLYDHCNKDSKAFIPIARGE